MKTVATVMQITRGLLILTPAEYDKPDGGFATKGRRGSEPTVFNVPQIFELNDSLKEHPFEKTEELAAFVKRCASSVGMELGDVFICIEDEDVLITKEYKHAPAKEKLLRTFAQVEAERVLHADVKKYTILNYEYGQQFGKSAKNEDISASLFAINTGTLTDIRSNFEKEGIRVVKVGPPIAGMLHTSRADINSATTTIAVISMDFAATRLVVLHKGAPVFQQSFSSVLEDIAEMFSLEFGMSKMGAIDLIRQEGLGVCNKCKSADTRKQTMTMLDNAAGEILRNIRMVISTQRLDINQIILCDALSKLPNIRNYCRKVGLTAPIESVENFFISSAIPPAATSGAAQKGFDASSFITLNGLLTMPLPEANLLMGEADVLSAMKSQSSSKVGNLVAGVICAGAALWMISVGGMWFAKQMQKNSDDNALADPIYETAKDLIAKETEWTNRLNNVEKDLAALPSSILKSEGLVSEVFTQVADEVQKCESFTIVNGGNGLGTETHRVTTNIELKDYDAFVDFKNKINDTKYFKLVNAWSVTESADKDSTAASGGGSASKRATVGITLNVTDETMAKATEEAEEAKAKEEGKSGTGSDTKTSDTSSQASS